MLKKRELTDCYALFELMIHPDVFPFVRNKAETIEEYMFHVKNMIEEEEQGKLISRTILDEWENPIGCISLYEIEDQKGFLGTWLGKPYHGKGFNQRAKDAFFCELFYEKQIEAVFMKIRKTNMRSLKAAEKLPYAVKTELDWIGSDTFHLYEIPKDLYTLYSMRTFEEENRRLKEA
ncbi:GNAT family N-acetyltransferase [Bacillus haynesii]|uniref:GNAT family N-acetyltransferase n=1 Tax=Bacillus haynesii TaxID=1925021 RepID=UPI001593AA64|nr:GNAT family N-acetyltransferase [Bacillus haynesii]NVB35905.1 GNAT family N-acetyltransferase [Bacillus licheniformis]MCY8225858.1 GNAT family N-acetyltransferase [Bacillus haynesii]MEC1418605.1 GNAT family N-acetyltransferase [Bacillus haynesii]MEC1470072.1 GNAT family N-acetyltransferase [Bacillus haynesii]MEC1561025.1 GNAT family N-acetyltransferase [Bacillus haynesii]